MRGKFCFHILKIAQNDKQRKNEQYKEFQKTNHVKKVEALKLSNIVQKYLKTAADVSYITCQKEALVTLN